MPGPLPQVEEASSTAAAPPPLPPGTSISTSEAAPDGATAAQLVAGTGAVAAPADVAPGVGDQRVRPPMPSPAQQVLRMVEELRRAEGLPALDVDDRLVAAASQQALAMSAAGQLSHQPLVDDLDGGWDLVGENVGYGPNAPAIFDALVASDGHHANLVHARFTHIGIAVVTDGEGRLWVSQVFGG